MAWKWVRHAFAIERERDLVVTPRQAEVVERLCREVVSRGLATPAIAFLEMSRPLNGLGAQALHFFQPMFSMFSQSEDVRILAEFLEHRGSIDYVCRRIESLQGTASAD